MNILKTPKINKFIRNSIWIFIWNRSWRKALKAKLHALISKEIIKQIEEKHKDYWIFFPRWSFGDIALCASYVNAFKQKFGGKVLMLTIYKTQADFIELYPSIDKALWIEDDRLSNYLDSIDLTKQTLQKGQLYVMFAPYISAEKKCNDFGEDYRNFLNIDNSVSKEKFQVNENDRNIAYKKFKELKLKKNKTIFLAPHSVTFNSKDLSTNFWETLADKFINLGYCVIFNSDYEPYKKYGQIFLPITQTIPFLELCKATITFRSGLSDIIALSGTKNMSVIYPHDLKYSYYDIDTQIKKFKKSYAWDTAKSNEDNLFRIHSLNNVFNRSDIDEIIFNQNESELISYLIEKYTKGEKVETVISTIN